MSRKYRAGPINHMIMPSAQSPIVVLDSGLGGLTVVRAIRQVLPAEDIVYFGDTARLPYGSKSAATVTNFVRRRQLAKVFGLAAPLLAPIIEDGRTADDPLVRVALRQYLQPLLAKGIHVLVLGCTHYPIYRQAIAA